MITFSPLPTPRPDEPSGWDTRDQSLFLVIQWKWETYKPIEKTPWDADQVCSHLQNLFLRKPQVPIVGIGTSNGMLDVEDGERRLSALGINLRGVSGPEVRFDITTCRWEPGVPDDVTKISRNLMLHARSSVWQDLYKQIASKTSDHLQVFHRIIDCNIQMSGYEIPVTTL